MMASISVGYSVMPSGHDPPTRNTGNKLIAMSPLNDIGFYYTDLWNGQHNVNIMSHLE